MEEAKQELNQKLKHLDRVWKTATGLTLLFFILGTILLFTSCEKTELPDKVPITVQVQTSGLIEQKMTKSFSVDEWIFTYNPNPYNITFTGTNGNVYTYSKTIAQLQTGFTITVLPDNYTVTYESQHIGVNATNHLSTTLDIGINQTVDLTSPISITLTANHKDYLVVMDFTPLHSAAIKENTEYCIMFSVPNQNYKYAYYNQLRDLEIRYNLTGLSMDYITKILTNPQLNNIYHIVQAVDGSTTINILPFSYNTIGW